MFVIIVHREWGNNFARTADKQSDNFSVFVSAIAFRQLKYNFDWYLHLLVDQQLVSKYLTFQELNSWPTSDSNSGCLATTMNWLSSRKVRPYFIFVISFTQAFCAVEIFYTQNALFVTKLNSRQKSVNRSNALCKIIHCGKIPIYCVKSPIQCKITCCGQNCTLMFDYTMKIINCLAHFV